jgi:cell wall-associated NlpC family hydrolase
MRFVHAPSSGGAVRTESMRLAYWARRFDGARRVAL